MKHAHRMARVRVELDPGADWLGKGTAGEAGPLGRGGKLVGIVMTVLPVAGMRAESPL